MPETLLAASVAPAAPVVAEFVEPRALAADGMPPGGVLDLPDLPAVPRGIARTLALRTRLWRPLVRFAEPRFCARIAVGLGWEAWLLTWLPGQSTALHDHGGSSGAFTVLSGTVDESVLLPAAAAVAAGRATRAPRAVKRVRSCRYRAGEVRSFGPGHLRDVAARGGERAITLHVYTPRLTTMTRYALTGGGLVATSYERAGEDW
jgi:hypothetical protein